MHALEQKIPAHVFEQLAQTDSIPFEARRHFSNVSRLASRLSEEAMHHKQRIFTWLCEYSEKPVTPVRKQLSEIIPLLTKSQLEEMSAVLGEHEKSRLHGTKLTSDQRWEADHIRNPRHCGFAKVFTLDSVSTPQSLSMTLFTLEQLPGWPTSHCIGNPGPDIPRRSSWPCRAWQCWNAVYPYARR